MSPDQFRDKSHKSRQDQVSDSRRWAFSRTRRVSFLVFHPILPTSRTSSVGRMAWPPQPRLATLSGLSATRGGRRCWQRRGPINGGRQRHQTSSDIFLSPDNPKWIKDQCAVCKRSGSKHGVERCIAWPRNLILSAYIALGKSNVQGTNFCLRSERPSSTSPTWKSRLLGSMIADRCSCRNNFLPKFTQRVDGAGQ